MVKTAQSFLVQDSSSCYKQVFRFQIHLRWLIFNLTSKKLFLDFIWGSWQSRFFREIWFLHSELHKRVYNFIEFISLLWRISHWFVILPVIFWMTNYIGNHQKEIRSNNCQVAGWVEKIWWRGAWAAMCINVYKKNDTDTFNILTFRAHTETIFQRGSEL